MYQIYAPEITDTCACIKIEFSAGTMIDCSTWIPASSHNQCYQDLFDISYDDLVVQISLSDQILFEQSVGTGVTTFSYNMIDSSQLELKQLKIQLKGINSNHHQHVLGKGDVAVMLRIHNVWLEELSLRQVLENLGTCFNDLLPATSSMPSEFMGINGYQLLEFTTPVYRWLLDQHVKFSYYNSPSNL